jgi:hypothetical protein
MTINVYWSCLEEEWMRAEPPMPLYEKTLENEVFSNQKNDLRFCPALKDYFNNKFLVKSLYSYDFIFDEKLSNVTSSSFDQNFWNNHVLVRSLENKLLSFSQNFIFFTEQDSLPITVEHPFMEESEYSQKCITIPGTFDIAKWYRNLELAFYLKKSYNSVRINEGDSLYYIKFHTDEKINFIQYRKTPLILEFIHNGLNSRRYKAFKKMSYYYNIFKLKKMILKEIKNNLI